jgi:hypothetical protein
VAVVCAEGLVRVARRDRDAAEAIAELVDGRRNRVGGSGAVWVRRCFGGDCCECEFRLTVWCCETPPDEFVGIAARFQVRWHTKQG